MSAANTVIKVAALSGSLRKASYNTGLIRAALELSKESVTGIEVEHVDISQLPMLNTDLIVNGARRDFPTFPRAVEAFRQTILKADSVLFACPENSYSIAAPLKNAIEWASLAPNCWGDKAAAVASAGGVFDGGRLHHHLRQVGGILDLHFTNKPEFFLDGFQDPAKFDSDGNLIDAEAKEKLKGVLVALRDFTLRLKN